MSRIRKLVFALLLLTAFVAVGQATYPNIPIPITVSGGTFANCLGATPTAGSCVIIPNPLGAMNTSFEELVAGAPASSTITVYGCMKGATCESVDANATNSAAVIRGVTPTAKPYGSFVVVATFSGGTNVSIQVNPLLTTARGGGGGSTVTGTAPIVVTAGVVSCPTCGTGSGNVTGSSLTSGIPLLGNGGNAITVGAINLAGGSSIVTGNLPAANLGSGTGASVGTLLHGDMSWSNNLATLNLTTSLTFGGVALQSSNLSDAASLATLSGTQTFANKTFTTGYNVTSTGGGTGTFALPVTAANPSVTLPGATGVEYAVTGTANSGGVPCFTGTLAESSSVALTSNVLTKGGGAGACPTNSALTDSGTLLTYTGTAGMISPLYSSSGGALASAWTTNGLFNFAAATFNDNTSTGTVAATTLYHIGQPTLTATSASTYTSSATFTIDGPPIASTNVTQTSPIAFAVTTGVVQFGGVTQSPTFEGTAIATAVSVCGGKCTGTQNAALGGLTVQGSDNSNTGASAAGGALTLRSGDLTAAATNGVGADVILRSGLGTGNAVSSHTKIQSPSFSTTSGTTAETSVTTYTVHKKAGSTTSATATNMFSLPVAASQTLNVTILVSVSTTQATPQNCATNEIFVASVQNTAATITQQTSAGTLSTICSTGTLTLTAAFSAATPSVFSVTPSWTTIVPTGVIITVTILNGSQQDVTFL